MKLSSLAIVAALGFGMSGCAEQVQNFQDQLNDFNPMGTRKARLPGERRAMFPEGVPGVVQGVPPDLMKGAPREPDVEPAAATPEKPAAKPRTRRVRTASPVPPRQAPRRQRAQDSQAADAPSPQQAAPARAPASSGNWSSPPAQAPAVAWPDPPKAQ